MRTFKTSVKGNEKLLGNLNFYIKMNLKLMDVGVHPFLHHCKRNPFEKEIPRVPNFGIQVFLEWLP